MDMPNNIIPTMLQESYLGYKLRFRTLPNVKVLKDSILNYFVKF